MGKRASAGKSAMYDLDEHRHRFSVWAAARAVQRGFSANVDVLREAIKDCGVEEFVTTQRAAPINYEEFEQYHREWCGGIVAFLKRKRIPGVSYGRAAKLLAVYLKSMVVLGPGPTSGLARVVHPPIDGILLRNLIDSPEIDSSIKTRLRRIKGGWTQLNKQSYYDLVSELRKIVAKKAFWTLERFWTVTNRPVRTRHGA